MKSKQVKRLSKKASNNLNQYNKRLEKIKRRKTCKWVSKGSQYI